MLDAAVASSGYTLFKHAGTGENKGKVFKFFRTDADVHLKFDVALLKAGSESRPKPKAKKLRGKEPAPVPPVVTGVFPLRDTLAEMKRRGKASGVSTVHGTLTPQSKKTSTTLSPSLPEVIHLAGDTSNPYAGFLTKQDFESLGNIGGCNWCRNRVRFGYTGITVYLADNMVLCPTCAGNEEVSTLSDVAPASRIYVSRAAMAELR
jgi:hypothetical protein